ncbi:hypothetical protein Trydic_g92 [Trypoxylus dichotomus]
MQLLQIKSLHQKQHTVSSSIIQIYHISIKISSIACLVGKFLKHQKMLHNHRNRYLEELTVYTDKKGILHLHIATSIIGIKSLKIDTSTGATDSFSVSADKTPPPIDLPTKPNLLSLLYTTKAESINSPSSTSSAN